MNLERIAHRQSAAGLERSFYAQPNCTRVGVGEQISYDRIWQTNHAAL